MSRCEVSISGAGKQIYEKDELEQRATIPVLAEMFPVLAQQMRQCIGRDTLASMQYAMSIIMQYDIADPWTVILAPTGTGKTLTYLMPVFQTTLEHVAENPGRSFPTALIFTTTYAALDTTFNQLEMLTANQKMAVAKCAKGTKTVPRNFDILVSTAGTFTDLFRHASTRGKGTYSDVDYSKFKGLKYVVIDEMDQFLKDFDNLKLIEELFRKTSCQLIFSSATRSRHCSDLIQKYKKTHIVITVVSDLNIETKFYEVASKSIPRTRCLMPSRPSNEPDKKEPALPNPFDLIVKILREVLADGPDRGQVMIFMKRKDMLERFTYPLISLGFKALPVYSGQPVEMMDNCLKAFTEGKADILLSSLACTRGYDSKNVRHVINYDLPQEFDDYCHQRGRTGRNGTRGTVHTFIDFANTVDYNLSVISEIAQNLALDIKNNKVEERSVAPFFLSYLKQFL